ncbi:H-NS family nucleoid-associated regulatory protein [Massilia sp. ST3]|uniref:H-NS histone family protein n=1 Tax=Massilia sp. ST3 TaxID=2824903 RepID=UPI001B814743|nr:H-NS histone family protein [Massilia sp. ST3]MBQ5946833.1 H-NS histone family protein [Massilia sp. ST3]
MANIDLSSYNLGELKGLQFEVEKQIKARQQDEVKKAREQILALTKNLGVSVDELLSTKSAKAGKSGKSGKGKAKAAGEGGQYRNPADASQTWTGRGRRPAWVAEALAGGKTLDQLKA